ncbi:AraC family transcriptional regulator [Halalkalibacterium halodurans]|uniref:BH0401 protein n=1 Tax=Halalkalibacterium halodurans (strain ATCC BAA-125 / DSM 18197 / FERM 7344 / JCM 9153 / C-125) TaxID=272558 RepID=Q9KFS6_HALH5|nr:AraC family transcriptional regulator [Halalkalibacterium halodurans]MED4125849.1 AraC family transcriptional regulator [Halalkalibacterium halodurans]MED4173581.1 AraC family transcriptional regulator [Halalkalibacterium halodurans]BAB04120.1 BH0401 [Halalkalibacterium halodurans C-125]
MSMSDRARFHAVFQYIETHYKDRIDLDTLANRSHLSKYHFSRLFKELTGDSPMAYVNKVRVQKAIPLLTSTKKTVLEIASLCGFDSVSTFNATFKKHYDLTPSYVRKNSNNSLVVSKKQEELPAVLRYDPINEDSFLRRIWTMNISIKELPDYEVAFVRHVGSYLETYKAWATLGAWASENRLDPPQSYFIGISLDDPKEVEEHLCRYDACVTLPEGFTKKPHEDIQFKGLSGGTYALYSFYDRVDKLGIVYQSIFTQWLPASGFVADDKPSLEFCMNDPALDPEGKAKVDLYIPIRKK